MSCCEGSGRNSPAFTNRIRHNAHLGSIFITVPLELREFR